MATETDPLLALRHAVQSKFAITYSSSLPSLLLSPSLSLPKLTPTRLRKPTTVSSSSISNPTSHPQDFFTLEAVYLAWLLRDAPGAEYMKQARENGLAVGFVSVTERKGVVEWLEGRGGELSAIVPIEGIPTETSTPPGSPPPSSLSRSTSHTTPASHLSAKASFAETSGSSGSPTKRRYVADPADMEIVKRIKANEVELRDRNTVLRGVKANNFSAIRTIYSEKLKKLKDGGKSGAAATSTSASDAKMLARKARNNYPIIMISSSPTALITMHNVKRFLQESTFEPSQTARTRAAAEGNPRPEDMIPIYRKRTTIDSSGKETEIQARYFVVDSVEALAKFGADAWERVVCVMTTGQAWQFRPYRWSEPKTLFHHVKGIYVTWSNDPPNTKIKDWNVTELKIDPHRRHVDKSVVAHFWKTLDTWIVTNKPSLIKG